MNNINEIIEYLKQNPESGRKTISRKFKISESKARKIVKEFKESQLQENEYYDLLNHSVNLEIQNQNLRDKLRVKNKIRDEYRNTSYLEEITTELINCFKNDRNIHRTIKHTNLNKTNPIGILQLTDAHFNEFIDLSKNKYNFNIASKRCKKFVDQAIFQFKNNNVEKVVFCMTGDLINSDRRADEKISMITSRAKACYLASLIIEQMILDLNQYFDTKVAFVVGNESRSFEIGNNDIILSDNYDLTIVNMLKLMFRNSNIEFLNSNLSECVINIKNKNILLIHGQYFNKKNIDKSINETITKFTRNNIRIDYIITGHFHETCITDFYGRSSSLCGSNGYSENQLNLSSRASQNIYIIDEWVNGMKIDLQNVDNIEGYYIDENIVNKLEQSIYKENFHINKIL